MGDEQEGPSTVLDEGPISMQAVGQSDLSDSLLGTLDSPRIPEQAIAQLLQGPTPLQQFGQALAGGVAFMRRQPNPVTPILEEQRRQNVDLATMLQRMNATEALNSYRKSRIQIEQEKLVAKKAEREQSNLKGALTASWDILKNPDASPAAMAMAQHNIKQIFPRLYKGFELPDTIIERRLDEKGQEALLKDAYRSAQRGPDGKLLWDEPTLMGLAQRWGNKLPAQDIPKFIQSLNEPGVLKSLNLQSNEDREKEILEHEKRKWEVAGQMAAPYEWAKDTANLRGLMDLAREMYPRLDPTQLLPEQRSSVSRAYDQEKRQQKQDDFEARADIKLQHGLQLLGTRIDAQVAAANAKQNLPVLTKPVPQGQQLKELNHYRGLKSVYDTLEDLQLNAIEVPKDMWPASGNPASRGVATFKRWLSGGEDKIFAMKTKMLGTISGMIERGILNDRGARALQTMKAELEAADSWPTYKAFKDYVDKYQTLLRNQVAEGISELEESGLNAPEVLKGAKGVLRRMGPQGSADKRAEPTAPKQKTPVRVWLRNTTTGARQEYEYVPGVDVLPSGWMLER